MHIFGIADGAVVNIDLTINNLEHLTRKTKAALHIVVAAVDGAVNHLVVGPHSITAVLKHLSVVIGIGQVDAHCVASGEVKHHNVAALHVAHALEAVVVKLRFFDVALHSKQLILSQGEVKWCLWHARTIHHLVYPQEVAREQCFLER